MRVKHAFTSAKSDPPDATIVRPTNWNADHTLIGAPDDAIWTPGSNALGLDDEFDDGSLAGAWTRVDAAGASGHLTWTESSGALSAAHSSSADGASVQHALVKSIGANSHPLTIQTAVRYWAMYGATYQMLGLVFADGATHGAGKQMIYMPFTNNGSVLISLRPYINYSTGNQSPGDLSPGNQPMYGHATHLKLVWSAANTFDMYSSPNGVDWLNHGQRVYTMTPTYAGIIYSNWGTSTAGVGVYEYFRVY
jgi:hypothetical protein